MKSWLARHSTPEDWKEVSRWQSAVSKAKRKKPRKKNKSRIENPNEAHYRNLIGTFWKRFEPLPNTAMRLELLREYSHPNWQRVSDKLRKRLRKQFLSRYSHYLSEIDDYCGICGNGPWKEKHHIVPLCFGGMNENENLIAICMGCHDQIHPWMKQ